MKKNTLHIVITDQRMPGMTGVDFLIKVLERYPDVMRVLLTGFTELTAVAEALSKGQVHYRMEKPWDEEQIRAVIHAAYEISLLRAKGGPAHHIDVASELEFILKAKPSIQGLRYLTQKFNRRWYSAVARVNWWALKWRKPVYERRNGCVEKTH